MVPLLKRRRGPGQHVPRGSDRSRFLSRRISPGTGAFPTTPGVPPRSHGHLTRTPAAGGAPAPDLENGADLRYTRGVPMGFVDLHSHVLFGLDDGSPDLPTSLTMLDGLAALGFSEVCATP